MKITPAERDGVYKTIYNRRDTLGWVSIIHHNHW